MFNRLKLLPAALGSVLLRALPLTCMVCLRQSDTDYNLCTTCRSQLPVIDNYCCRCGLPLATRPGVTVTMAGKPAICGQCIGRQFPVDSCRGLYHYVEPVSSLLGKFKYQARLDIGYSLSRLLAEAMLVHYRNTAKPDLLIPVPMHSRRYLQRGFNQAWEITRQAGARTGISVCNKLVVKKRHTAPQSSLTSAAERKRNLQGAFEINGGIPLENLSRVTLIDDVVTTMNTVTAIAKSLKRKGITTVEVWCIARATRSDGA